MVLHNDKWHNKNRYKYLKKHNLLNKDKIITDDKNENEESPDDNNSSELSDIEFDESNHELEGEVEEEPEEDLTEINDRLKELLKNKKPIDLNTPLPTKSSKGKFIDTEDLLNWSLHNPSTTADDEDHEVDYVHDKDDTHLEGDELIRFNKINETIKIDKQFQKVRNKFDPHATKTKTNKSFELHEKSDNDNFKKMVNTSLMKNKDEDEDQYDIEDNLDYLLNSSSNTAASKSNGQEKTDLDLDALINQSKSKSNKSVLNPNLSTNPSLSPLKIEENDDDFLDEMLG